MNTEENKLDTPPLQKPEEAMTSEKLSNMVSYSNVVSTSSSPLVMYNPSITEASGATDKSEPTRKHVLRRSPDSLRSFTMPSSLPSASGFLSSSVEPHVSVNTHAEPHSTILQNASASSTKILMETLESAAVKGSSPKLSQKPLSKKPSFDDAATEQVRHSRSLVSKDASPTTSMKRIVQSTSMSSFKTAKSADGVMPSGAGLQRKAASHEGIVNICNSDNDSDGLKTPVLTPSGSPTKAAPNRELLIDTSALSRQLAATGKMEKGLNIEEGTQSAQYPFKRTNRSLSNVSTSAQSQYLPSVEFTSLQLASDRRNQEFHALFRSVPEDDPLIEDFSCALQKDIIVQGRLYISRGHMCFNSNIFGWVTNLVISLTDVLAIERRMTAYVIPNAIHITTLHSKYLFTSFMYREPAYIALVKLWRHAMGDDIDGIPFSPSKPSSADKSNSNVLSDNNDTFSDEGSMDPNSFSESNDVVGSESKPYKPLRATSPVPPNGMLSPVENQRRFTNSGRPPMMPTKGNGEDVPGSLSDSAVFGKKPKKKAYKPNVEKMLKKGDDDESSTDGYVQDDESAAESSAEYLRSRPSSRQSGKYKMSNIEKILKRNKSSKALKLGDIVGSSRKSSKKRSSEALAPKKQKPASFCDCHDHCSIILVDKVFPVSLVTLAGFLYGSPAFFEKIFTSRGMESVKVSNWEKTEKEFKVTEARKLEYNYPLRIPPLYNSVRCTVSQNYTKKDATQYICVRECTSVPIIGSLINVLTSQCLMRVSDNECRLLVGWEIDMGKQANSLFKAPIEKVLYESSKSHWSLFEQVLMNDCKAFAESLKLSAKNTGESSKSDSQKVSAVVTKKSAIREAFNELSEFILEWSPWISFLFLIFAGLLYLQVWSLGSKYESISSNIHSNNPTPSMPVAPEWWSIENEPLSEKEEKILARTDFYKKQFKSKMKTELQKAQKIKDEIEAIDIAVQRLVDEFLEIANAHGNPPIDNESRDF
ncbi:hypothetical protein MP638_003602 [Amoeboaphelidium occidentale]|nr:hypothetical protein MP638_003602 [Amoeboaphelidium occidentale]